MKHLPKIFLGILILIILVVGTIIFHIKSNSAENKFTLSLKQDKFKLEFQINSDKHLFEKFLESLTVPQDVTQGLSVDLDATSTAKLAFVSPISGNFAIKANTLKFDAKFDRDLQLYVFNISQIKIPQKVALSVFGPDLTTLVLKNLDISQNQKENLKKNMGNLDGQYLTLYPNGQFALYYKKENLPFDNFKEVPLDSDAQTPIKVHVLETDPQTKNQPLLTIFEENDFKVLTSSAELAKEILDTKDKKSFPSSNKTASVVLNYDKTADKLTNTFFKFLLNEGSINPINKSKIENSLEKIKKAEFVLNDQTISALINLE